MCLAIPTHIPLKKIVRVKNFFKYYRANFWTIIWIHVKKTNKQTIILSFVWFYLGYGSHYRTFWPPLTFCLYFDTHCRWGISSASALWHDYFLFTIYPQSLFPLSFWNYHFWLLDGKVAGILWNSLRLVMSHFLCLTTEATCYRTREFPRCFHTALSPPPPWASSAPQTPTHFPNFSPGAPQFASNRRPF